MPNRKSQIGIRVNEKTKEKLQQMADKKDTTISEIVRQIVNNYVNLV